MQENRPRYDGAGPTRVRYLKDLQYKKKTYNPLHKIREPAIVIGTMPKNDLLGVVLK